MDTINFSPKISSKFSFVIGTHHKFGFLASACEILENHGLILNHIESKSIDRGQYEFHLRGKARDRMSIGIALKKLKFKFDFIEETLDNSHKQSDVQPTDFECFPKNIKDLDKCATRLIKNADHLDSDHPGINDPIYIERRKLIAKSALNITSAQKISNIEYTISEVHIWNEVFNELAAQHVFHACEEYQMALKTLTKDCLYKSNIIPQLQNVSEFTFSKTKFTLRPIGGTISMRDFLNGLAFRVYFCVQYMRHTSYPLYSCEYDLITHLIGHVPLLCIPVMSDFLQDIGMASLGASDDDILKLSRIFWHLFENGQIKNHHGERKAYGSSLLTNSSELQYSMTNLPTIRVLNFDLVVTTDYSSRKFQQIYYLIDSFKELLEKFKIYKQSLGTF